MIPSVLPTLDLDERYARLRLVRPATERSLRDSLAKLGQLQPLVACPRATQLAVVDGFKRLHAARALGLSTLRVSVVELSETAAISAVMTLNRAGRGLTDLEQALCVQALVRQHGLTQVAVGELLGCHKSWVCRRLSLAERLCETVADDVRAGLLTTSVAREVARLPRGNQAAVAAAISRASLTSHQGAELVRLFERTSDMAKQARLLEHPREALLATSPPPLPSAHDPGLGSHAQALSQRLHACLRTMGELGTTLERCTPSQWTESERDVLFKRIDTVQGAAASLVYKLTRARVFPQGTDHEP